MNLIEEADVKQCRNEAGSKKVLTLKSDQRKCYIDTHHRPLPHPSPLLTMSKDVLNIVNNANTSFDPASSPGSCFLFKITPPPLTEVPIQPGPREKKQ